MLHNHKGGPHAGRHLQIERYKKGVPASRKKPIRIPNKDK